MDHTYPPEKFLAHLSARVTFQLGPQPVDIQSYLTWHSRRMSLLYCSLTGTAYNWYDRFPQVYKDDWSSFLQIFKKQFYSQKHAYHAQIEALSLLKKDNENVRHFALKVETLVKQGWYNEYPSTINLKCNEIFTRGLPKKLKNFANKRQVKHISSSLEPSIPFHSLVNMVDSEDITLEKIKTQELSLEINNLSNTFQQNTTIKDSPPEPPQVQVLDPNNKSKPQFKKYCSFCHKNNHSVSTCFRRLNILKESKPQSRSPTPTFYQHFKNPSNKPHYSRHRSRSYSNPSRTSSRDARYRSRSYSRSHSRPRFNNKTYSRPYSPYYNRDRSRYDKHYNPTPYKSYSSSRTYYHSNSSRSPSKYYPRSRERSSNFNTSTFNRYNSPYRPPSKPRNDRYRSRSNSNSYNRPQSQYKPSVNLTQTSTPPLQTNSKTESIFEINMYHPNISSSQSSSTPAEHANAITPSTWFVNLYIFKPTEDTSIPSKLELLFLLDSGASICVLNLPTFTILADHFLKCSTHSPYQNEFKTLTVANKSEVPILHNVTLTLHTSLNGNMRTLVIPFAVANIKYNILGTPFFEKYVKTLNIENMSLTFNTPHESRINTLPFTAHKEKDYPYFSYIYTINVKNKIYFKPNASQIIHFPLQPTLPLTFKTSDIEVIFPSTPHPYFNTRFNSTFKFLQVYQNVHTEPSSCSVIIQNITHHSAILSPGYIGYIEVPATNIQPTHYKVNDVNSLIHTVFHSYYPDISEPKPPRRRSSLRNPHVEINNLQPSQILKRPLPLLP